MQNPTPNGEVGGGKRVAEEVSKNALGCEAELGLFGRLGGDGKDALLVDGRAKRGEGGVAEAEEVEEGFFAGDVGPVHRRGVDPAGIRTAEAGQKLVSGCVNGLELGSGFGITYQLEEQVGVRTAAQPGGAVVIAEDIRESKALIQTDSVIGSSG